MAYQTEDTHERLVQRTPLTPREATKKLRATWVWGLPGRAVPYLIFIVVHQEEPAEFHNQGAAVGDSDIANDLGVVQDAAEIYLHHLEAEVGVMHLSTQAQAVHLRVLHILHRQDFFCHPVVQVISVGRVKLDQQIFLFIDIQFYWL